VLAESAESAAVQAFGSVKSATLVAVQGANQSGLSVVAFLCEIPPEKKTPLKRQCFHLPLYTCRSWKIEKNPERVET
jgi:hypothetical protein